MTNRFLRSGCKNAGALGVTVFGLLVACSSVAFAQDAQPSPNAAQPQPPPQPQPYPQQGYPQPQPYPPPGYGPPPGSGYPPPGYGYQPPIPPGYHTHDGFYMRLAAGGGYAHASTSYQNEKFSGGSIALDMAFGGAVTPNLVIYGAIVGHAVPNPTLKVNGSNYDMSGTTFNAMGVGPGVTYYIMPQNIYASGTLLLHFLSLSEQHSNQSADLSDTGVGFSLMFGKEWWVSPDWGLGVAGQFMLGSAKLSHVDARWTTVAGGVLFSATYN